MDTKEMLSNIGFFMADIHVAEPDGHLYKKGDICLIEGMESCPEYNGTEVEITNIREDTQYGKAYYIEGKINEIGINYTHEFRLKLKE